MSSGTATQVYQGNRKTKVIAIVNPKGGVGKTTIAANMGYYLACLTGEPLLFIDLNPCAQLTRLLLTEECIEKIPSHAHQSLFAIFERYRAPSNLNGKKESLRKNAVNIATLRGEIFANMEVFLMPGSHMMLEMEKTGCPFTPDAILSLRYFLEAAGVEYPWVSPREKVLVEEEQEESYIDFHEPPGSPSNIPKLPEKPISYIIIDTPPSLGFLTMWALSAAHSIIIPVVPEYMCFSSFICFLGFLKKFKEDINPELSVEGIVINQYEPRYRAHRKIVRQLKEDLACISTTLFFNTEIPRTIHLVEASDASLPVFIYRAQSAAAMAFEQLVYELLKRNGNVTIKGGNKKETGIQV